MSLFGKLGKKNRAFRKPDEEALLSENLIVSLWSEPSESGVPRINFKLNRVSPKDPTKTLTTLNIGSLYEIPEALGNLAIVLSEVQGLPSEERSNLKHFGSTMEAAAKVVKSNGLDEEARRPETQGGILKRLAA